MNKLLVFSALLGLVCLKSYGQVTIGSTTSIDEDQANSVRFNYSGPVTGNLRIVADSWMNFYTDRSKFFFSNEVVLREGIRAYSADTLRLKMNLGYLEFRTDGWMNFYTDRSAFFFDKSVIVRDGIFSSYGSSDLRLQTNGTTSMTISNATGNVGIGTTTTGSHKLAVEGSIGARSVTVEPSGWSDFVFEGNYGLRTLEEVESHIEEKGHLPEIPSEAEVLENGIELGEMNAKLLQKIEELTLYLIDQNKQNQEQQKRIALLEQKIADFEN